MKDSAHITVFLDRKGKRSAEFWLDAQVGYKIEVGEKGHLSVVGVKGGQAVAAIYPPAAWFAVMADGPKDAIAREH